MINLQFFIHYDKPSHLLLYVTEIVTIQPTVKKYLLKERLLRNLNNTTHY